MRSFSLPLSLKIIEPVPLLFASALKIKSTSEEKPSLHLTVPLSTIILPVNVETPTTLRLSKLVCPSTSKSELKV